VGVCGARETARVAHQREPRRPLQAEAARGRRPLGGTSRSARSALEVEEAGEHALGRRERCALVQRVGTASLQHDRAWTLLAHHDRAIAQRPHRSAHGRLGRQLHRGRERDRRREVAKKLVADVADGRGRRRGTGRDGELGRLAPLTDGRAGAVGRPGRERGRGTVRHEVDEGNLDGV